MKPPCREGQLRRIGPNYQHASLHREQLCSDHDDHVAYDLLPERHPWTAQRFPNVERDRIGAVESEEHEDQFGEHQLSSAQNPRSPLHTASAAFAPSARAIRRARLRFARRRASLRASTAAEAAFRKRLIALSSFLIWRRSAGSSLRSPRPTRPRASRG